MAKRSRPPQWHLLFTAIGLLAAVSVAVYVGRTSGAGKAPAVSSQVRAEPVPVVHVDAASFAAGLAAQGDSVLGELGILPDWIQPRRATSGGPDTVRVRVPADLPLASVNLALSELAAWHGGHVVRGVETRGARTVELTVGIDTSVTTLFQLRLDRALRRRSGRLALILRAETPEAVARVASIEQPLTVALPAGQEPAGKGAGSPHEWRLDADWPPLAAVDTLRLGADGVEGLRRALWALAERAADTGQAVAVAPARPETFDAFEMTLPRLERRGYRFVTVTQLPKGPR